MLLGLLLCSTATSSRPRCSPRRMSTAARLWRHRLPHPPCFCRRTLGQPESVRLQYVKHTHDNSARTRATARPRAAAVGFAFALPGGRNAACLARAVALSSEPTGARLTSRSLVAPSSTLCSARTHAVVTIATSNVRIATPSRTIVSSESAQRSQREEEQEQKRRVSCLS